jgi:L-ascorbate metabolism protein UlaG (beta-lactamase superfamily)
MYPTWQRQQKKNRGGTLIPECQWVVALGYSMTYKKKILILLMAALSTVCIQGQKKKETPYVELTWMSNTNWLIETEDVRILLDGWITRIPRPPRPDLKNPETLSVRSLVPDTAGVKRVFDALGNEKKIKYILSSHSHFDHSYDTAVWTRLTAAQIIGPRSTCLQALAQGIPESQCSIVRGGETFDLGRGLNVRVVRWHHSGDISTPLGLLLQTPMELIDIPKLDLETGGLRPGILEDFPNGGGSWAYLFTLDLSGQNLSWFFSSSGNADTFRESRIADETFLREHGMSLSNLVITPEKKSIEEYLTEAMHAEKLDHVDLWLGYNNSYHVEQVISVLKPKAFIPQHWGGLWSPFFEGLKSPYSNERLISVLEKEGIGFYLQRQYMDKFRLDTSGITPVPNDTVKERLGFSE